MDIIYPSIRFIVRKDGGDDDVDSAMYTTMPIEEMADHPGGEIYDLLKPSSWKVMMATVTNDNYWETWVGRSLDGILNAITGKHGIGKPYVDMRNAMMLGTLVTPYRDIFRIKLTALISRKEAEKSW